MTVFLYRPAVYDGGMATPTAKNFENYVGHCGKREPVGKKTVCAGKSKNDEVWQE